jgi:hypothetical protein
MDWKLFACLREANLTWQWAGGAPPSGGYTAPVTASVGSMVCTFVYDDAAKTTRTSCASHGRELWHHDETRAFIEDAALAIDGTTLYSARFSDIASGCVLHAFDATTDRERWSVSLVGLGRSRTASITTPSSRVVGARPVVFGWESAGRYVEARDPTTRAPTLSSCRGKSMTVEPLWPA